ncbi:hypothetical protein MJA45_16270 [Paenibacillus aurantius]|uniref:Uncharacterized protein n=1 Tax=Paenibacillus aurantius TaxID=2918900 RepID=A0AA96L9V5_9BACL|nr:hypothetical protein [Paenibacillus aurantius]WJH34121.1 hypothetical protein N6H14_29965 [Paenibacillus sp. CC-CFT747]WNQ09199.1 hypothetical protein MJA45_16270 [Paenibacillus aurantius]
MEWTDQDKAVLEMALNTVIAHSGDYQEIGIYREVLDKLQGKQNPAASMRVDTAAFPEDAEDGFRYDYDDASDLYS